MVVLSQIVPALLVAAATSVSAATHDTHAKITKKALNNNLDYLQEGLQKNLKETAYTKKKWEDGWIPQSCKSMARDYTKHNARDFEVWDVTYSDCEAPWVFCHHKTSGVDIDLMAKQFSKVPIQMRQWVRHVMDVPSDKGSAFEIDANVVFKKPHDKLISVILHEVGHAVDLEGAYDGAPLSGSDNFWKNFDQDVAVPDNYAQSNMVENVAQNTVVAVYNENVPGQFAGLEKRWQDIFHQYATVIDRAIANGKGNNFFKPGQNVKCTHRKPPSARVSMDGKRRDLQGKREAPAVGLPEGIIPILDKRQGGDLLSNCSIGW